MNQFLSCFLFVIFSVSLVSPAFAFTLTKGKSLQEYYDNPKLIQKEEQKRLKKQQKKEQRAAKRQARLKRPSKFGKKNIYNTPNLAPVSNAQYEILAQEKKREELIIPEPRYPKDSAIVELPDPKYRISKYNVPAGAKNLNITSITSTQKVNSVGVLSPDKTKIVFSSAFYYPTLNQVVSAVYYIKINPEDDISKSLMMANELRKEMKPVLETGFSELQEEALRTLTLVDWSVDSKKIAVKERVGSCFDGVWKTNLIVYDFETNRTKYLSEVREAIKYWWKNNENLDLVDYMWDIFPIGWDANNPDRILLYAYAYTDGVPKFLGTWSIDYKGNRSQLMSAKSSDFEISTNGYMLNAIIRE